MNPIVFNIWVSAVVVAMAGAVLLGAGAGCQRLEPACALGACDSGDGESAPRSAVDWSAEQPVYTALLRVTDEESLPVAGAKVAAGEQEQTTDDNGEVALSGISALQRIVARISGPGFAPTAVLPRHDSAGLQRLQVRLQRLAAPQVVDTSKAVTVAQGAAQWRLPPRPFSGLRDEVVATDVNVQMLSLSVPSLRRDAVPADSVGRSADGTRVLLRDELSLIYTHVTDLEDNELSLAPGRTALLKVRLPGAATVGLDVERPLGLYALDEEEGRWQRESSCTIEMAADSGELECVGAVTHFSYWLVAREWAAERDGHLSCVSMHLDTSSVSELLQDQARFVGYLPLLRCGPSDGCVRDSMFEHGLRTYLAPGPSRPFPALCGVAEAGATYRFAAGLFGRDESASLVASRFTVSEEPSYAAAAQALLQGSEEASQVCSQGCQQVVLRPDPDEPLLNMQDKDGDGYATSSSGLQWPQQDCDDEDPDIHPGAPERLCDTVDRDCDGVALPEGQMFSLDGALDESRPCARDASEAMDGRPLCPWVWNRACAQLCLQKTQEVPGNAYDEDCDGHVVDRDGDGYDIADANADAVDCDDLDPESHPGAIEVAGNERDENCDGIALDADGDGYYAYGHEAAAAALGKAGEGDPSVAFGDCDDWDGSIHPGVEAQREAGQLDHLFTDDGTGHRVRAAAFCDYFKADGTPSKLFWLQVRDRNCDGVIIDVDGDGLTSPQDVSLGANKALDCDDYDPRIGAHFDGDGKLACMDVDRSALRDERRCSVATHLQSGSTSECPVLAGRLPTECKAVVGTDGLCTFAGWNTADPLRWTPGALWGTCDGPGRLLPDCVQGSACGSPVPYSDGLMSYLRDAYTEGQTLEYQGMCFLNCNASDGDP